MQVEAKNARQKNAVAHFELPQFHVAEELLDNKAAGYPTLDHALPLRHSGPPLRLRRCGRWQVSRDSGDSILWHQSPMVSEYTVPAIPREALLPGPLEALPRRLLRWRSSRSPTRRRRPR